MQNVLFILNLLKLQYLRSNLLKLIFLTIDVKKAKIKRYFLYLCFYIFKNCFLNVFIITIIFILCKYIIYFFFLQNYLTIFIFYYCNHFI